MRYPYSTRKLSPSLLLAMLIYSFADPLASAGLYKWVDEDGTIRYSDRLPADQVKKSHTQLNSQGMVVTTRDAAKSEEDLAAEAEARRKQEEIDAEEARIKKIQQQQDQVLLMTFSTVEELDLARENRLEVLNSVINLIQNSIESTQQQLNDLQNNADTIYLSQGKEVPGGLAQKIEHYERKIQTRTRQLELKLDEKAKINSKYDHDRLRLLQLRATPASN